MIKLKEHPLLAHIDSVQLEELQRVCQEVILSKGETLFRQEEVAHFIYFVREGTLKILKTSLTGQEKIFSIYQKPTNNLEEMVNMGVHWWNDWDIGDGTIGQRYGATVSRYDLINNLIKDIQNDPYGRRKIVSLWQETDLHETAGLAPCAFLTMWNVRNDNDGNEYLDMCLVQRSGDMLTASGAGCINEVQYAALLMMIARHCGYKTGRFTHFVANEQIYDRHEDQARAMLNRYEEANAIWIPDYLDKDEPKPMLVLNPAKTDFYDIAIDDFEMLNYDPIKPQLKLELGI